MTCKVRKQSEISDPVRGPQQASILARLYHSQAKSMQRDEMSDPILTLSVRNDNNGNFDELFAKGATVHIEMMDDRRVWIGIEADGKEYGIWISSKSKLDVFVEDQSQA